MSRRPPSLPVLTVAGPVNEPLCASSSSMARQLCPEELSLPKQGSALCSRQVTSKPWEGPA